MPITLVQYREYQLAFAENRVVGLGSLCIHTSRAEIKRIITSTPRCERCMFCWPTLTKLFGAEHQGWCHAIFPTYSEADAARHALDGKWIGTKPITSTQCRAFLSKFAIDVLEGDPKAKRLPVGDELHLRDAQAPPMLGTTGTGRTWAQITRVQSDALEETNRSSKRGSQEDDDEMWPPLGGRPKRARCEEHSDDHDIPVPSLETCPDESRKDTPMVSTQSDDTGDPVISAENQESRALSQSSDSSFRSCDNPVISPPLSPLHTQNEQSGATSPPHIPDVQVTDNQENTAPSPPHILNVQATEEQRNTAPLPPDIPDAQVPESQQGTASLPPSIRNLQGVEEQQTSNGDTLLNLNINGATVQLRLSADGAVTVGNQQTTTPTVSISLPTRGNSEALVNEQHIAMTPSQTSDNAADTENQQHTPTPLQQDSSVTVATGYRGRGARAANLPSVLTQSNAGVTRNQHSVATPPPPPTNHIVYGSGSQPDGAATLQSENSGSETQQIETADSLAPMEDERARVEPPQPPPPPDNNTVVPSGNQEHAYISFQPYDDDNLGAAENELNEAELPQSPTPDYGTRTSLNMGDSHGNHAPSQPLNHIIDYPRGQGNSRRPAPSRSARDGGQQLGNEPSSPRLPRPPMNSRYNTGEHDNGDMDGAGDNGPPPPPPASASARGALHDPLGPAWVHRSGDPRGLYTEYLVYIARDPSQRYAFLVARDDMQDTMEITLDPPEPMAQIAAMDFLQMLRDLHERPPDGHGNNGHGNNWNGHNGNGHDGYGNNGYGNNGNGNNGYGHNGNGHDGYGNNGYGHNGNGNNGNGNNGNGNNGYHNNRHHNSGYRNHGYGHTGYGNNRNGNRGNGNNGNGINWQHNSGHGNDGNGHNGNGINWHHNSGHGNNGNGHNGYGHNEHGNNGNGINWHHDGGHHNGGYQSDGYGDNGYGNEMHGANGYGVPY